MFFAVSRIAFESAGEGASLTAKDIAQGIEKLRAKFRIVCSAYEIEEEDGQTTIVFASLGKSSEALSLQLDQISAYCEDIGLGRIATEDVLMDHVDAIGTDSDSDDLQ